MKSHCFKLNRAYSNSSLQQICWQILLKLNSTRLYQSSGKEKQSCCLVFMPSTKHEITHTHITVVQHEKHDAHAKLLFCKLKPIVLFSFLLPSPYSLLTLNNNLTVRYSSLGVIVFSVMYPIRLVISDKKGNYLQK